MLKNACDAGDLVIGLECSPLFCRRPSDWANGAHHGRLALFRPTSNVLRVSFGGSKNRNSRNLRNPPKFTKSGVYIN